MPGMISGVVPLVLKVSPGSVVAGFCEHVDTRMREALQHQRFPVHAIANKAGLRGAGRPSNRVVVNFIPTEYSWILLALRDWDRDPFWPRGSVWAVFF